MIKLKDNKVIIELEEKEIKRLLNEGVLFEPRKEEFKFLDERENIYIKVLKGNKTKHLNCKTKQEIKENENKYINLDNKKIGKVVLFEYFNNDVGNDFKKWCLNCSEGYFNFYTEKELLSFIKNLKGDIK